MHLADNYTSAIYILIRQVSSKNRFIFNMQINFQNLTSYRGREKDGLHDHTKYLFLMLRLHWTTFSLRPYHVLKIQERSEDGVKLKQFGISKFPLRPYYVPATSILRAHHVLTTSFTFPLRPQYALTKFIPFPLRPCYVLTKTKQFIPRANYVSSTF